MAKERKTTLDKAIDVIDAQLQAAAVEYDALKAVYEAKRDALIDTIDAMRKQQTRRTRKAKGPAVMAVASPPLDRKTVAAGN